MAPGDMGAPVTSVTCECGAVATAGIWKAVASYTEARPDIMESAPSASAPVKSAAARIEVKPPGSAADAAGSLCALSWQTHIARGCMLSYSSHQLGGALPDLQADGAGHRWSQGLLQGSA